MANKKVWLGKWGPYQYNSTDTYSDSGDTVAGIRVEGQILVETAPSEANHVVRLTDLSDVTFIIVDVADIADPSAELVSYSYADANCIIARKVNAGILLDQFTIYVPDETYSGAENIPYVVAGSVGSWTAVAGSYALNLRTPNVIECDDIEATGFITAAGLVTVGTTLGVTGASTLAGAVTCSTTLGVTGNSTLGGTLAVTGTSAFTGAVTTTAGLTVGTALTVAEDISVSGDATHRVTRVISPSDIPYDANLTYNKAACAYVTGGASVSIRCPIPYMAVGDTIKHVTLLAAVNDGAGGVTATVEALANGTAHTGTPVSTALVSMTDQASNNLTVEEADVDITVTDNQAYGLYLVIDGGASGIAAFGGLFVDIETRNY